MNDRESRQPRFHTPLSFTVSEEKPILASRYDYTETTAKPNLDMHYGLELRIVLAGKVRRFRQDMHFSRFVGDVWVCGMLEPHGFQVLECPCSVVVMDIWPPLLANLYFPEAPKVNWMSPFTQRPEDSALATEEQRKYCLGLGERLSVAVTRRDPLRQARFRLLLLDALMLMMEGGQSGTKTSSHYNRIYPALTLVWRSKELITNKQAAQACNASIDAFSSEFRNLMGISFAKFALRHRLHSAASGLVRSSSPLKVIASEWGFTDAAHLHRLFVKHYGCTPKVYRQRFE